MAVTGRSRRRAGVVAAVACLTIALDQVTKSLALADLRNGPVHVIGPFSFQLEFNTGIAFSLFSGIGLPIVLLALCVIGLVVWFARGRPNLLGSIAIGLVMGGACGNLADRIFRGDGGAVVDFIHTSFWPTFNVADASVVCGSALLVIFFLRSDRRPASPEAVPQ